MSKEMREHINKFNKFRISENLNISDVISSKKINENYTKNEKIVELDIVDMDKEESILSIKVLFSTAKEIGNALHKDRKNGGRYKAMFDENKDFRYWKD
jgi:hypothetical protein